jgi:hypothetical protein
MKKMALFAMLLLLAACGGSGGAAAGPLTLVAPLALEPPPVYSLLGYRTQLELTSEQIVSLDSIATAVRAENTSLVQELRERTTPRRGPSGVLQVDSLNRPLLEEIRENNRLAAEAVGEVLTAEQEVEVCRLNEQERVEREEREGREGRRRVDGMGGRGRNAIPDDQIVVGFLRWPWCGPAGGRD